jgi:hypothetical protein
MDRHLGQTASCYRKQTFLHGEESVHHLIGRADHNAGHANIHASSRSTMKRPGRPTHVSSVAQAPEVGQDFFKHTNPANRKRGGTERALVRFLQVYS